MLAGAVVAAATMILLSLLGVAFGASGLNIMQTTADDLKSYGVGAGIWGAINMILSMAFGGYVAARLSGTHSHLDGELHGITVWAVALLLATVLLARVVSGAIGTVATGAATAAGGALSSAGSLTSSLTQTASPQALLDRLQQSLTSSGDPTQMTRAQITSEIAVLTGRRVLNGRFTDQERDRLNSLVAVQAGITKEEAARRVLRMEQDATTTLAQAEQQARAAADTAARGAAMAAKRSSRPCSLAWRRPWSAPGLVRGTCGCSTPPMSPTTTRTPRPMSRTTPTIRCTLPQTCTSTTRRPPGVALSPGRHVSGDEAGSATAGKG